MADGGCGLNTKEVEGKDAGAAEGTGKKGVVPHMSTTPRGHQSTQMALPRRQMGTRDQGRGTDLEVTRTQRVAVAVGNRRFPRSK